MTEISDKILQTIKDRKIIPTSKLRFLLKNYLWAIFAFVMVVFGSLAFSVLIFYLKNEDWELYGRAGFSKLNIMLLAIPYFWILLSILFLLVAYYNFRHTQFGYRQRFSVIVLAYFSISLFLGSGAYFLGAGRQLEGLFFNNNLVFYGQLMEKRQEIWNKPEKGLIAGQIIFVDLNNNELQIIDPVEKVWLVDISHTRIPPFVNLNFSQRIRVIGKILSENNFEIYFDYSWLYEEKLALFQNLMKMV
jgi:hypothetical protein